MAQTSHDISTQLIESRLEKWEHTCAVQSVNVFFAGGGLLLDTESDLELASLVVCAVGNGHELLVLTATSDGEPGLEIALHGSGVVCVQRLVFPPALLCIPTYSALH